MGSSMKQQTDSGPFELKADAFIRGETTLAVVCVKPFDEVALRLEASIAANEMTIVQVHDLGRMLEAKGVGLDVRCRVCEVVDRKIARASITSDANLAHVFPWRIAMHDRGGVTTVVTPMPTVILTEFSYAADVARLAHKFQSKLQRVLQGLR
jgi:uncharacterized protein (DUF302 family)